LLLLFLIDTHQVESPHYLYAEAAFCSSPSAMSVVNECPTNLGTGQLGTRPAFLELQSEHVIIQTCHSFSHGR
jgi:hypothetical protein